MKIDSVKFSLTAGLFFIMQLTSPISEFFSGNLLAPRKEF